MQKYKEMVRFADREGPECQATLVLTAEQCEGTCNVGEKEPCEASKPMSQKHGLDIRFAPPKSSHNSA